jgi:hypothetical protein
MRRDTGGRSQILFLGWGVGGVGQGFLTSGPLPPITFFTHLPRQGRNLSGRSRKWPPRPPIPSGRTGRQPLPGGREAAGERGGTGNRRSRRGSLLREGGPSRRGRRAPEHHGGTAAPAREENLGAAVRLSGGMPKRWRRIAKFRAGAVATPPTGCPRPPCYRRAVKVGAGAGPPSAAPGELRSRKRRRQPGKLTLMPRWKALVNLRKKRKIVAWAGHAAPPGPGERLGPDRRETLAPAR